VDHFTGFAKEFSIQMKFSLVLPILLGSGLALSATSQAVSTPAPSAPTAQAGPSKVAVIAFQMAVAQTNEGQRNFAEVEKKFEPKRQQLKNMSDELDTLTKQLQTDGEKLSAAERASREKVIDDKKKVFDRDADDAKNDFQGAMQDAMSTLASKVYDVLADYAHEHGYTVVLDESSQQGPVLLATSNDITKAVIEAYNKKSGVPPPAPAATAKPSAPAAPAAKPAAKPATAAH
jgi:outer membrane protein